MRHQPRFRTIAGVCTTTVTALACSSRDPVTCPPVANLDTLLGPDRILLVGEVHGTAESPDLIGRIACRAVAAGLPATVGLEIPSDQQPAFDTFMASDGREQARAELLGSPFWHRDTQDGRSSAAMFDLVETLRDLAHHGDLRLVLVDDPDYPDGRDAAMAANVAAAADTTRFTLVLTGNLHNRLSPDGEWMGRRLAGRSGLERVRSLNLTYTGGSAWVCLQDGCAARRMGGNGRAVDMPTVRLGGEAASERYNGIIDLGAITASPPAVGG